MESPRFLHTGSSLLNLALTGDIDKGWPVQRISNIIGDTSTGKTLLAIEAACNVTNRKKPGEVVYIESESAFDTEYAQQLGLEKDKVDYRTCRTVEELYVIIKEVAEKTSPDVDTLIIVDSLDALSSTAETEREMDKGTFNTDKQRKLNEMFRRLVADIESSNIHLMLISQLRVNIGAGLYGPKHVRSGGKSLDFFSTHILWLYEAGKMKDAKSGLVQGMYVKVKVTKNKISNPHREAIFPIIPKFGIDEVSSLIEFLTAPDYFPPEIAIVNNRQNLKYADEEDTKKKAKFIEMIENDAKEYDKLKKRVQAGWEFMENQAKLVRKKKNLLGK